jgi:DNA-binding Lrp family transcriptional regulator
LRRKETSLDEIDKKILTSLQMECRTPLERIAKELCIPKSTVRYRIKRLEEEGVIEGYHAKVNAAKLGKDYITLTFVRARYGPSYHNRIGKMLAQIPGVSSVYFVFGEYDFVVLTKSSNTNDFLQKLERMTDMTEIERTNTQVVGKTLKEDQTIGIYS